LSRKSVRLHPRLADVYAQKVLRLAEALNDDAIREEANELLRSLVARIEGVPAMGQRASSPRSMVISPASSRPAQRRTGKEKARRRVPAGYI
jgi:hypothetical protein